MKKLRIAVWHNLPSGGGKRQLYLHVKGLIQRGHYVESWCPDTADQNFLSLKELTTEHVIPLDYEPRSILRRISSYRLSQDIKALNKHSKECCKQINSGNFDILLSGACLVLRAPFVGRFSSIPTVLYLGEPNRPLYEAIPELPWLGFPRYSERKFLLPSLVRPLLRHLVLKDIRHQALTEHENARNFQRILVNSLYSRESILKAYNLESRVSYLGVDHDYYKPTGEDRGNYIIGMGTFHFIKGIDRAIKAISEIDAAYRPPLVWVGNTANRYVISSMDKLARSLNVKFTALVNITDREVISLLSRARVMIYTSRLEPFGFAPLEANACGTPVVGIAEGGVRETMLDGTNGFLVQEDNPQRLGSLLARFIHDPELSDTIGQRARKHIIENWNLDTCIDSLENHLYDVIREAKI